MIAIFLSNKCYHPINYINNNNIVKEQQHFCFK